MKRFLLIFVLLTAMVRATTGDVTGTIRTDGWSADLAVAGFTSGATYDFDWRSQIPGTFTSGTFTNGETVTQNGTGDTAVVVGAQSSGTYLLVKTLTLTGTVADGLYAQPAAAATTASNSLWVGQSSGATFTPKGGASVTVPGPNTPYYTVVRQGYNNAATLGTATDTVYLTTPVLVPYSTATINITAGTGTFTDGETVSQAVSGATAIVVGAQAATNAKLRFRAVTGTFNNANVCTGGTSGAVATSTSTITTLTAPAKDELVSTTALTTRVALSEYINLNDNTGGGKSGTAPTLTIPAGAVVNTGGGAQSSIVLSAVAQTNNSTLNYANSIGRFVSIPYKLLNGNFTVEFQAFNRYGRSGQPVACVKFTFTDGTVTRSQTITSMSKSADADALPVYAVTDSASNFTQGANVVCQAQVYPWVGNASNGLLDSSANAYQNTGMNLSNWPVGVCDKNSTYGVTYVSVKSTGNDGTGVASATQATAEATPCLTIGGAWIKAKAFNNTTYSRNTVDAVIVTVQGTGFLFGDGGTAQANTSCETIVQPGTGYTQTTATITGPNGGGRYAAGITRIYNMTCAASSTANQQFFWCHNTSPVVLDTCIITGNGGATAITSNDTNGKAAFIAKNCTFSAYTGGISGGNDHIALYVRGGSIKDVATGSYAFSAQRALCGVTVTDNSGLDGVSRSVTPLGWTDNGNVILSYNVCDGLMGAGGAGGAFYDNVGLDVADIVLASNLVVRRGTNVSPIVEMSGAAISNFLAWHNTFAGQRINTEGMLSSPYTNFTYSNNSLKYNSFYYNGTHNQFDAHSPVTATNGGTTGQWPYIQYGVGWYGNNREIRATEKWSFDGPYSSSQTVAGYTNDKSASGIVTIAVNSGTWFGTFQDGEVVYQTTTGATGYANGAQSSGSTLTIYSNTISNVANNSSNWNGAASASHVTPTAVPTTGATGGNYVPSGTSILKSRIPSGMAVLPYDLAGNAISNTGSGAAGAYQFLLSTPRFFLFL